MEWALFWEDESLLKPEILEEEYNKLPADIKTTLAISQDELEIGGFKQFLGHYGGKRLRFYKGEETRAKTAFIELFIDNSWLITQIKDLKGNIEKLRNLEDWTNRSKAVTDNESKHDLKHSENNSTIEKSEDTRVVKSLEVDSDRNSSGFISYEDEGQEKAFSFPQCKQGATLFDKKIEYPVNAIGGSAVEEGNKTSGDSTTMQVINTTTTDTSKMTVSREYGNKGETLEHYLNIRLPDLRKEFWAKFDKLFYF